MIESGWYMNEKLVSWLLLYCSCPLPERRAKGAFRYCDPKMTELNKADLERVRTCINRGILESTVLTTIRARNEAFLQKKCSKNVTFAHAVVDSNASKIIQKERIAL